MLSTAKFQILDLALATRMPLIASAIKTDLHQVSTQIRQLNVQHDFLLLDCTWRLGVRVLHNGPSTAPQDNPGYTSWTA